MKRFILWLLLFYRRFLSPLKAPTCRFCPSCSSYALEAITKYGVIKGGFLSMRRLLRCHPLNQGGYDQVP
ncbi:MAG TPA: membrane protein insertion efficiency factor YidD [Firmicutes bacterium]|nr:membrane protein insertion efficiency factor YidD [Bacillota bacterium]